MNQKFTVKILIEDFKIGGTIAHKLDCNSSWTCSWSKDVIKELKTPKNSSSIDSLILYYNFSNTISSSELIELLRKNYKDSKILCIVPEDFILRSKDILLEPNVVDIIRTSPILLDMVWNHLVNIYNESKLKKKLASIEDKTSFIANSHVMQEVNRLIEKAASSDINVCIYGETGTGKDVIAKQIHKLSNRATYPFVAVNVAAIPNDLAESLFFGHEKGAFTGATSKRIGFFEEANNGTLFLDEIGDMDLKMQVKLLRAVQEGRITRLGGNGEIAVNVRIIIATHIDMNSLIEKNLFREDLYYRLMGLTINVPKLSQRGKDILSLANMFITDFCAKNKMAICHLSEFAEDALMNYHFPGNIRELKSIMELAVVLCNNNIINKEDLSLKVSIDKKRDLLDVERTLEAYEAIIIKHFLNKYNNKVRLVADKLRISKTKIYSMIQDERL